MDSVLCQRALNCPSSQLLAIRSANSVESVACFARAPVTGLEEGNEGICSWIYESGSIEKPRIVVRSVAFG